MTVELGQVKFVSGVRSIQHIHTVYNGVPE